MAWVIEQTDEFAAWWGELIAKANAEQDALEAAGSSDVVGPVTAAANSIAARIEHVGQAGPNEKRPAVGKIEGLKVHKHLKEVICTGAYRVLFGFGPDRNDLPDADGAMILLIAADKSEHGWNRWYVTAVPHAEALYDEYLQELHDEGKI